jgi:large subunit ribosomal protein L33
MAAKGKENRIVITLACTECKSRNYVTTKNKKNDPDRMVQRKYCVRCRTHREHRETK